ncbi:DUF1389 domain-containing protein [Candidatus Chlamydia corallus]|uniref:DUF1389 domain-containing protein n=1 Tax=Candidatus Chlamydia corallus TaxID=2038470 RepID=UPI000C2FCCE4|nr:DUF1389 domain-containing protein [Candidatus Chlamydia corallus]
MSNMTSPVIHNSCIGSYYFEIKNSTIIHIAVSAILILGALLAFLCAAAPISCIISGVLLGLGLLIALIGLILGIKKVKPVIPSKEQLLPEDLLKEIRPRYPNFVSDFILEAKPNLNELMFFIDFLNKLHSEIQSDENYCLPESLQCKIDAFGGISRIKNEIRAAALKRLKSAAHSRPLFPPLKELLQKLYPFFWLGEFISSGSNVIELYGMKRSSDSSTEEEIRDYVKKEMLPIYWFIPLGFKQANPSILNLHTLVLARVLTQNTFRYLKYAALNGEWNLDNNDLNSMKQQLFAMYRTAYQSYENLSEPPLEENAFYKMLFFIFKHQYSWKQMSLIKTVPCNLWENLCSLNSDYIGQSQNMELASLIGNLYTQGLINRKSEAFLPLLTLLNLDQFKTIRRESTTLATFLENLTTYNSTFKGLLNTTVHPLTKKIFAQPQTEEEVPVQIQEKVPS